MPAYGSNAAASKGKRTMSSDKYGNMQSGEFTVSVNKGKGTSMQGSAKLGDSINITEHAREASAPAWEQRSSPALSLPEDSGREVPVPLAQSAPRVFGPIRPGTVAHIV